MKVTKRVVLERKRNGAGFLLLVFTSVQMLAIQLSKGEYLVSHNQFRPAWILIIMCCGFFVLNDLKWEVIVYFVTLFFFILVESFKISFHNLYSNTTNRDDHTI